MIPKQVSAAVDHLAQLHEEVNHRHPGHGIEPSIMCWNADGKVCAFVKCRPINEYDPSDHERSFMEMFSVIHVAQAEHVLFCADSWFTTVDRDEIKDGVLPRASESANRMEALNLVHASREVTTFTTWTMPYIRDDEGHIYWVRMASMEAEEKSKMEGIIADGFNHFFNVDQFPDFSLDELCSHLNSMGHWAMKLSDSATILDHLDG